MLLEVNNITKYYDGNKVLDNVSFTLEKGEILGLLGPNGAGKTTTMKIITSNILPTSGNVKIKDFDTNDHTLETQKHIGYLAENNPLYTEMFVYDFLKHIQAFYENPMEIEEAAKLVDIKDKLTTRISELSKGYKQRVGIAAALLNNPELLILDEANEGLDPAQRIELRKTIKNLSKDKGVIVSTHVLEEVKTLCDRVVIIDKGKIIHNSKISDLTNYKKYRLQYSFTGKDIKDQLKKLALNKQVEIETNEKITTAIFKTSEPIEQKITDLIKKENITLYEFSLQDNLEEVFDSLKRSESEKEVTNEN